MPKPIQERTALIIDDEPGVCAVLKAFARKLGMGAATATSGAEGLRLLEQAGEAYGLVILDYRLLDMNGVDCFKRVRERRADMPVLFITSYGAGDALDAALDQPGVALINKPFSVEQFGECVARVAPSLLPP